MPRFTIDIDDKFDKLLSEIAEQKNSTKAEAIRAAVASYSFLQKQLSQDKDAKVSITNQKDEVLKDIQLP
jgi:predicted transcriptional regulator